MPANAQQRLTLASQISYKVEGTVQGVNFRNFTVKQAKSLALTGYVENAADGSVEGEAQGSDDAIKQLLEYLHKGPSHARVSKVDHREIGTKSSETGFAQR